MTTGERGPGAV